MAREEHIDDGQPRGTNRPYSTQRGLRKDCIPRKVLSVESHEFQTTIPEISMMLYDERRRRAILQGSLEVVAAWLRKADHLRNCRAPVQGPCRCGLDAARCAADSEE